MDYSYRTAVRDLIAGPVALLLIASPLATGLQQVGVAERLELQVEPLTLDFDTVDQGTHADMTLTLTNRNASPLTIETVSFLQEFNEPSAVDFTIEIGGVVLAGSTISAFHILDLELAPGEVTVATVTFTPTEHESHSILLSFGGEFEPVDVALSGTGGSNTNWGFLHPVLNKSLDLIVDYDGDAQETIQLFGSESHTHEPGHSLALFEWKESGVVVSNEMDPVRTYDLGATALSLTIYDDNQPPAFATQGVIIQVFPPDEVPGALAYYHATREDPADLLDAVPSFSEFIERRGSLNISVQSGGIGGSGLKERTMVRLVAGFEVPSAASYAFAPTGGTAHRLEIDGQLYVMPVVLQPGPHQLDVRFAVGELSDLPLAVPVTIDGTPAPGFYTGLTHGELGVVPTIHDLPRIGSDLGGNRIVIRGFGYYPRDQVIVHWGNQDITANDFTRWTPDELEFFSPPGPVGQIFVRVETPAGISSPARFRYSDDVFPIQFHIVDPILQITGPTTGDWGPDGRFYVGLLSGEIKAITFDDDYHILAVDTYVGVSNLTNSELLGLAFHPFEPASPVRIYVTHSEHYQNEPFGGGPSDYTGQLSVLTEPNFDQPLPIITQLPTSNFDHAMNGIVFDHNGDLFLAAGGNTNAGVIAQATGSIGETPLSGSILKAELSRPDFNGALTYIETDTGIPNDDQAFGEIVDLAPDLHVNVHAAGMRNPYDLVYTTWRYLYCTDNGPNLGFGPASTGPDTDAGLPWPETDDDVNLVEFGNYYGHPNRGRGRHDPRQNVFHANATPPIPDVHTQGIALMPSSFDGIVEYRANSFGGAMRGNLIIQKWGTHPRRLELSEDRRRVSNVRDDLAFGSRGLDIQTGPGGALIAMGNFHDRFQVLEPVDVGAVGTGVLDIHPWRAPASGGYPFTIGGHGFGTLDDTSVRIGGLTASLSRVSATRIEGFVPTHSDPPTTLVDVEVSVGPETFVLEDAFRYLFPSPGLEPGFWVGGATLPSALEAVATGVIEGTLYMVGDGPQGARTFAYDLLNDAWSDTAAQRPYTGRSHSAEVVDGKLYLFGGLGGAEGRVQIYDPELDTWTVGTDMPWAAGAVATGVIGADVYVASGMVGGAPVANHMLYDPAADQWSALAPVPNAVSHASGGSDGQRFFLFGGRQTGAQPGTPLDLVQVFDPQSGWTTSADAGQPVAPLPAGRADMGRAVFYRGELYLFGGETGDAGDPDAVDGVFSSVFVHDPLANSWRVEAPLPTARHGSDPALFQSRQFVPGGGQQSGAAASSVLEVFTRQ